MVIVERARVLCDGIQFASQCTEGSPIDAVAVGGRHYVWPCFVNCRVDHEGCCVQQPDFATTYDLSFFIDVNEI